MEGFIHSSFQAPVELIHSAAKDAVAFSTELKTVLRDGPSKGRCWRSFGFTYKIPAEDDAPYDDIDLENEATQDRLEGLLVQEAGLSLVEIGKWFPPYIGLGCKDTGMKSFPESIFELSSFGYGREQGDSGVKGYRRRVFGLGNLDTGRVPRAKPDSLPSSR